MDYYSSSFRDLLTSHVQLPRVALASGLKTLITRKHSGILHVLLQEVDSILYALRSAFSPILPSKPSAPIYQPNLWFHGLTDTLSPWQAAGPSLAAKELLEYHSSSGWDSSCSDSLRTLHGGSLPLDGT